MYSRAHLLIERDHERFLKDKLWGIQAYPVNADNLFEWNVKMLGEENTIWEGGVFRIYMRFSEFYNDVPPSIYFHTIPFHPNVDPETGEPATEVMDDDNKWKPQEHYFGDVLLAVQRLLSTPCIEKAVNLEAASILVNYPKKYEEIALQCVQSSQKLEECFKVVLDKFKSPVELNTCHQKSSNPNVACKASVVKKKLPFEDYYATWSDIGTSKSLKISQNTGSTIKTSTNHTYMIHEENSAECKQQRSKTFSNSTFTNSEKWKKEQIERINEMKKLYLQQNTPTQINIDMPCLLPAYNPVGCMQNYSNPQPENVLVHSSEIPHASSNIDSDQEVDDLILWTDKLNVTNDL